MGNKKKNKVPSYRDDPKKRSDMLFGMALQVEDQAGETTPEAENWLRRAINALK